MNFIFVQFCQRVHCGEYDSFKKRKFSNSKQQQQQQQDQYQNKEDKSEIYF
jgi:hypothetical protein